MMRRIVFLALILFCNNNVFAHLCNDVFIQAKDNLAVKVDIRDGQLRISKTASFRVYLLNTMDRDIADIRLDVLTQDFDVDVVPSRFWSTFPVLETTNKGGQKEYFEVRLTRKEGVTEGKYKIALRLYNGRDSSMVFKTVDLDTALSQLRIPKKENIIIDGNINRLEWQDAALCTSLYEYVNRPIDASWIDNYWINKTSNIQTRFRFCYDKKYLYSMIDFQSFLEKDIANIYIASGTDSKPKKIVVDGKTKKAYLEEREIDIRFSGTQCELAIPFSVLKLEDKKSFYVNLVRRQNGKKTYWRGNQFSEEDPIIYAHFIL